MRVQTLAVAAVAFNAFAWGVSWWPFRALDGLGLHALWATASIYALALVVLTFVRPKAWRLLAKHPGLWGLCAASGITNMGFNWGIATGDVVRVVLCFYLMPMWSMLLAWAWLGDRPTRLSIVQLGLALAGVALVMWPTESGGTPAKPLGLPEALGLMGGLSFAVTNLLLRQLRETPSEGRSLAMFLGGTAFSGLLAVVLGLVGVVAWPPATGGPWLFGLLALAVFYLSANLTLQFGAARLTSRVTALVLLTEVVFASTSSILLGASDLTARIAVGGLFILAAAAFASVASVANGNDAK